MNTQIEILEVISKEERVKLGNVSATVRSYTGRVSNIYDGRVAGDNGQQIATFNQPEYSETTVTFSPECDKSEVITLIDNFIDLVKE